MKKNIIIFILAFLFVSAFATQQNTVELQRLSEKFKLEYEQKRIEAYQKAAQMNWPITFTNNEGSFAELQVLDEFGKPQYYITHNATAAQTISTDEVYTAGSAGLSLDGTGIVVREWDGGSVLTTHQEFGGRVTQVDSPASTHYHATHVAGTIMASGVVAAAKGMAFAATLRAFDWNSDTTEMASEAALGALISNHSYGYGRGWDGSPGSSWDGTPAISVLEDYKFGFYDSYSQTHDQIAYNAPDYLIVKSAGNDRNDYGPGTPPAYPPDGNQGTGYDCIGTVGVAKNILTVGAVNDIVAGYSQPSDVVMSSFSSWGPADDSRIKPDICGNGVGLYSTYDTNNSSYASLSGTSMSSPSVTGSLALLQQYYKSENSSNNMLAATLKGLVIHTADEAGPNNGPDYMFGWGLMNTETAADVIKNNGTTDEIIETSIANSGTYQINVDSDGTTPLVATICWTDIAGTPTGAALDPTTKMLVNDLDLRITKGASTYYPWKLVASSPSNAATNSGDNDTDNVEKVEVSSPVAGQYTITVTHKGTLSSSQNFSLIISGITITVPDITASPLTFSETLPLNSTAQQTLTITNNGQSGSTLNYDVIIASSRGREITELPKSNYPTVDIPITQITSVPVKYKFPPINRVATTLWYHNGFTTALNFGSSGDFHCAARFTSAELSSYYTSNDITQVRIGLNSLDFTTCTIKVWEGGNSSDPGTEIYSQIITAGVGWNTHTLTSPIPLITGNEYWVGYSLTSYLVNLTGTFGSDDGTSPVADKGGWYQYYTGSWAQTGSFNWCIEMVVDISSTVLTVTSPNGGEEWANGSSHNITWNHSGSALTNVKLDLSTNNGGSYSPIVASTPNDGSYTWSVSGTASSQCLVRVSDPAVPATNDVSNAVFRIYDTVTWLAINQDNGSLLQSASDNITLTFDSSGLSDGTYNVNLEISSNDPDEATVTIPVTLVVDQALPVTLSSFTAQYSSNHPTLYWETESESDNIGWNAYRANSSNLGQAAILNLNTIPGNGTTTKPSYYSFIDEYDVYENFTYWYWLESICGSGDTEMFGPVSLTIPLGENEIQEIPLSTELYQNFPNPFNPSTSISFNIKENETGVLTIYNIKGQLIVTKEFQTGRHSFTWDARDHSSGIYLYKLKTKYYSKLMKMLLVK